MTAAPVIELLLKSGLIAGAGLLLAAALRERPATEGVDILRATVLLLLALPVLMLLTPDLALPLLPAATPEAPLATVPVWTGDLGPVAGVSLSTSLLEPSPELLLVWTWAAGVVFIGARFALGLWTLMRWTRAARAVTAAPWTAPLNAAGTHRRPRLLASPAVAAPLSWGLPPGVVLIGEEHLARPECARAVLAHELAHIRRRDWLFLLLSRSALALFWFNPLVWWLHGELAARTEDAADAEALNVLDPGTYARTLVGLAADFGQPAAMGMTGPARSLSKRIARIMKTRRSTTARPLALALTIGGLVAIATPLAAVELTPGTRAETLTPAHARSPEAALWTGAPDVQIVAPTAPPAPPAPPTAPAPMSWDGPPAPPPPPAHVGFHAPPAPPVPPAPPAPPARGSYVSWTENGDPAARRAAVQARAEADQARAEAAQAQAEANAARIRARPAPQPASRPDPAAHAAARAQADAAEARRAATRDMARARVDMARGADDMERGAQQMREEARRLLDAAYRAQVIERQRAQGHPTTDAELLALSPRLARQADEMAAQAVRLRHRSTEG